MKALLALLLVSGLLIVAYGLFGNAMTYETWSGSYALFDSLGESNPLNQAGFRNRYDEHFLSREFVWHPVTFLGVAVTGLSFWGLLLESKKTNRGSNQSDHS